MLAVWVTFGPNKVDQYHQDRGAEFKKSTGKEGQCFHDEMDVLNAVREIHLEVKGSRRKVDAWTEQVIDCIEKEMMLVNPTSRKTAKHLYHRSKRFIGIPLVPDIRPQLVDHSSPISDLGLAPSPSKSLTGTLPPRTPKSVSGVAAHSPNGQACPPFFTKLRTLGVPEIHTGHLAGVKPAADDSYQRDSFDADTSLDSDKPRRHSNIGTSIRRRSRQNSTGFEINPKLCRGESEVTERGLERPPVNGYSVPPPHDSEPVPGQNEPVPGQKYQSFSLAEALDLRRQERRSIVSRIAGSSALTHLVNSLKGRDHVRLTPTHESKRPPGSESKANRVCRYL